jgi:TonB family protein
MNEELRFQELLDRWTKGEITLSDERELLALSRDDDFRKEALEGLLSTPAEPHAATIASLKTKIQAKNTHKSRRFPLPFLLSIAAIGITLVAAVWFFNTKQRAQPENIAQIIEQTTPAAPRTDSNVTPQPDAIANAASEYQQKANANPPASRNSYPSSKDQPTAAEDLEAASDVVATENKSSPVNGKAYSESSSVNRDKMHAEAAKPAPSLPAKNIEAPGALAKESSKKMSDSITDAKRAPVDPFDDAWLDYLRRNARLPEDARNHNISGSVRLQFTINDAGKAENIRVLEGLGYGCDEIAQKLLKAWTFPTGTNGVVRVQEIPFVR